MGCAKESMVEARNKLGVCADTQTGERSLAAGGSKGAWYLARTLDAEKKKRNKMGEAKTTVR